MAETYGEGKVKYSKITPRLTDLYPPWTEIRKNKEAIGHQFLNSFGIELEDAEGFLTSALSDQSIGTADLGQIYQIYKVSIASRIDDGVIIDKVFYNETEIEKVNSLRDFYSNNEDGTHKDVAIFDFSRSLCYTRKEYPSITIRIDGEDFIYSDITIHHVWNVFDEFALFFDIRRRRYDNELESNESLKERILNVFKFPANSTKVGLANGIGQALGLHITQIWDAGVLELVLSNQSFVPESIKIESTPVHESQISEGKLISQVETFFRDDFEYELSNVKIQNGIASLVPGSRRGYFITPVIDPGNIDYWTDVITDADEGIQIDILPYDYAERLNPVESIIHTFLVDQSGIKVLEDPITIPIRLRVSFTRAGVNSPSPKIKSIKLKYTPAEARVYYIYGVKLDAMHDEDFRKTLFNNEGFPKEEMKRYVQELSEVSPILWDRFRWDEAYWDVVDENLMGLEVLPHKWDPKIGEFANKYFQVGIGFDRDLFVSSSRNKDDWTLDLHNGYYYIGSEKDEHYLFSSPEVVTASNTLSIDISIPKQGSPIIVKGDSKYLKRVSFLNDNYQYSLSNTELHSYTPEGKYYLSYSNPRDITIENFTGIVKIFEEAENLVGVDEEIILNDPVKITYSIEDSFMVEIQEDKAVIHLVEEYDEVTVIYESQDETAYYSDDTINLDPLKNHIKQGFVYLTDTKHQPKDMMITATPDIVLGDGFCVSTILVDVLDNWNNPVLDHTPIFVFTDSQGKELSTPSGLGSINLVGQQYNRYIFRYETPDIVNSISDEGVVSKDTFDAHIGFKLFDDDSNLICRGWEGNDPLLHFVTIKVR